MLSVLEYLPYEIHIISLRTFKFYAIKISTNVDQEIEKHLESEKNVF